MNNFKSTPKVLILGSKSTLAKEFIKHLKTINCNLLMISKDNLYFNEKFKSSHLEKKLNIYNPNIIINFIGKFSDNVNADKKILFSNILPSWEIIKYYIKRPKTKIDIILIGSSSHSQPRKNYMLYAASKTALNNLVISSKEYFAKSKVNIKIFHPKTFGGKHLGKYEKKISVSKKKIAEKILKYVKGLEWKKK